MSSEQRCSECGSTDIIPTVRVGTPLSGGLELTMETNPKARFFIGAQKFDVRARVCCHCGFVKLFVKNPHELREFPKEQSG
jgi:ribosomal protein L37E